MQKSYDLIVAGGGTAGALCAIAAARSGVKTAVIEPLYSLGGLAANSGLTEMNAAGFQGKPLYKGIEQKILNRLLETGRGEYHFAVPMSSDPNVRVDRFRYDPEALKLVLEQLAMEAGVELFYGCTIKKVQLFMGTSYKIRVTTTLQITPDSRSHQTMVSRYIDFRILIHSYSSSLFIIHQFFHVKLLHKLHIMINHDFHQFRKRSLSWIPAK